MHLDSHRRSLSTSLSSYLQKTPLPAPVSTSDSSSSEPATPVTTIDTIGVAARTAPATQDTMSCRFSRRANCCRAGSTFTNEDGVEMRPWHSVRRSFLFQMRRQVKYIVLAMALMEAIRIGPANMVYAGKEGFPPRGPEDYGLAYNVGYFLVWLYICLFSIIWVPVFSWWVPTSSSSDPENPGTVRKIADFLQGFNMILLPIWVALSVLVYISYLVQALIYIDARPVDSRALPQNTKKNWMVRLMLLVGILISTTCGYASFQILADMDLAHVKCVEYCVIVVPIQINIGLLLGSAMQYKMEKRIKRKTEAFRAAMEEGSVDEKKPILAV